MGAQHPYWLLILTQKALLRPESLFPACTEASAWRSIREPHGIRLGVLGEPHSPAEKQFWEKGWHCLERALNFLEATVSSSSADVTCYLCFFLETMEWVTHPSSLKWFLVKTRRVNMSWRAASTQCAAGVRTPSSPCHPPCWQMTTGGCCLAATPTCGLSGSLSSFALVPSHCPTVAPELQLWEPAASSFVHQHLTSTSQTQSA